MLRLRKNGRPKRNILFKYARWSYSRSVQELPYTITRFCLLPLLEGIRRSEFFTGDRELGRSELTPLGESGGTVELEMVP